jgi:hypothetical protein
LKPSGGFATMFQKVHEGGIEPSAIIIRKIKALAISFSLSSAI